MAFRKIYPTHRPPPFMPCTYTPHNINIADGNMRNIVCICMCVCKTSAAPAHARVHAQTGPRRATPELRGVLQTPHPTACPQAGIQHRLTTIGSPSLCGRPKGAMLCKGQCAPRITLDVRALMCRAVVSRVNPSGGTVASHAMYVCM